MAKISENLTGKFLIAMPGMGDPRFENSLIYICDYSDDGAMGLIVNKPVDDPNFDQLCDHLLVARTSDAPIDVVYGGPVEQKRGFVLHTTDYTPDEAGRVLGHDLAMSTTLSVIEDLARGQGPTKAMVAMGFAGWSPGQLEREIQENTWLICEGDPELIFSRNFDEKWKTALVRAGVDPRLLAPVMGHA
jgi:putative transcriptional regulator